MNRKMLFEKGGLYTSMIQIQHLVGAMMRINGNIIKMRINQNHPSNPIIKPLK